MTSWKHIAPVAGALTLAVGTHPAAQEISVEELLRRLEARDAAIARLEARVEQLERRSSAAPAATPVAAPPPSSPQPAAPPPPPAQPAATRQVEAAPQRAPGSFDVDPEAAERALERTLVLRGDLLLPSGRLEVEPFGQYSFTDDDSGRRIIAIDTNNNGIPDDAIVETVTVRTDEFTAGVGLRLGLPYDMQLEASLPFNLARRQIGETLSGASEEDTGSGIGDIRIGLAKTLVREQGFIPDIIGRVAWDTNTGRDEASGVPLDSGYNEFSVSLSAVKRQDPLAFIGRLGFETALENDNIRPGNLYSFGIGAVLAASPDTSLSLNFDAAYRDEFEFDGRSVDGSDQNVATLSLGASSVVGRATLVNVNVGAGLTDDGANYFFNVAVPFRSTLW
jgi:hypothetical protein